MQDEFSHISLWERMWQEDMDKLIIKKYTRESRNWV